MRLGGGLIPDVRIAGSNVACADGMTLRSRLGLKRSRIGEWRDFEGCAASTCFHGPTVILDGAALAQGRQPA
jgi:hypothetical protein